MKKSREYQSQTEVSRSRNLFGWNLFNITVCLPRGIDLSQFLKQFQKARLAKTHKNNGKGNM